MREYMHGWCFRLKDTSDEERKRTARNYAGFFPIGSAFVFMMMNDDT